MTFKQRHQQFYSLFTIIIASILTSSLPSCTPLTTVTKTTTTTTPETPQKPVPAKPKAVVVPPIDRLTDSLVIRKRFDISPGNNQGLAFDNNRVFVGYDAGNNKDKIEVYNYITGTKIKEATNLAVGHCADMKYNKSDRMLYIANGGGANPTHVYAVDIESTNPTIKRDYNLESLGTSACIALDETNNRFFVITAKTGGDRGDRTFTPVNITTGDIVSAEQFTIPFATLPYIPQGAVYKNGRIYFLFGINSTILVEIDTKTKSVSKRLIVPATTEPEGIDFIDNATGLEFVIGYRARGVADFKISKM